MTLEIRREGLLLAQKWWSLLIAIEKYDLEDIYCPVLHFPRVISMK
jgi:hypothetical protein